MRTIQIVENFGTYVQPPEGELNFHGIKGDMTQEEVQQRVVFLIQKVILLMEFGRTLQVTIEVR